MICLTKFYANEPVLVNPRFVVRIQAYKEGLQECSHVELEGQTPFLVAETVDKIIELIKEAKQ